MIWSEHGNWVEDSSVVHLLFIENLGRGWQRVELKCTFEE